MTPVHEREENGKKAAGATSAVQACWAVQCCPALAKGNIFTSLDR